MPNSADGMLCLTHVDAHNALGLGDNVPVTGSVNTGPLLALFKTGQFVSCGPSDGVLRAIGAGTDRRRETGWKGAASGRPSRATRCSAARAQAEAREIPGPQPAREIAQQIQRSR